MSKPCAFAPAENHSEDGFTLPELIIVMMILMVVLVMAMTSLTSLTSASAKVDSKAQSLADARSGLEVIARDLRAATPIDAISPSSAYSRRLQFSIYCSAVGVAGCSATNRRLVKYEVVDFELRRTANGVTRVVIGPSGPSGQPRSLQRGAVVNSASTPVFAYLDADSSPFQLSTVLPSTIRDCTRSVQIRLAVISEAGAANNTIDLATEVNLRNYNEVNGC